jgi:hypothetical protein
MPLLSKDQILEADDLKTEVVKVPEWGGEVRVRGAMAFEMDAYEQSLFATKGVGTDKPEVIANADNSKARLVVKCVVDLEGERLFKDEEAAKLGKKSSSAINRLFQKIQHLSGRTKAARDELEKNSEPGQPEGSSSSLPGT